MNRKFTQHPSKVVAPAGLKKVCRLIFSPHPKRTESRRPNLFSSSTLPGKSFRFLRKINLQKNFPAPLRVLASGSRKARIARRSDCIASRRKSARVSREEQFLNPGGSPATRRSRNLRAPKSPRAFYGSGDSNPASIAAATWIRTHATFTSTARRINRPSAAGFMRLHSSGRCGFDSALQFAAGRHAGVDFQGLIRQPHILNSARASLPWLLQTIIRACGPADMV